jgi:hypothetical protein
MEGWFGGKAGFGALPVQIVVCCLVRLLEQKTHCVSLCDVVRPLVSCESTR